ncbi:unnamed protein product [Zymoseptoria tritici ST99CH_1E4]|uniref:Uncharacterized protein n=1 Tax=Zymoseptoria tritici ST99CH_1E4 TaxID=1276532 RepID=A0A2H1GQF4_ZYMTR|nr:unnamed protein product [Zymoseptoria tritici ST99CH_1E4]
MATQVGLANSLSVTGSFALPFGLYYTYLQSLVIRQRMHAKSAISPTSGGNPEHDPLLASVRAQGNFLENVPLCLILSGLVESNGGDKRILTWALSALFVARVAHAQFGITSKNYMGKGRAFGFSVTAAVLNGLAGYSAWLVKGYWGY